MLDLGRRCGWMLLWAAIAVGVGVGCAWSMESAFGIGAHRPLLACVSLIGLNVVTYSVWPSRWNVLAHVQLAFSLIAYVIPIMYLHSLDTLRSADIDLYYQVLVVGVLSTLLGCLVGARAAPAWAPALLLRRWDFTAPDTLTTVRRRAGWMALLACLGIAFCFYRTGNVPAFSPDPLSAKFFKGAYQAAYQPVAPIYRAATTVIPLLMPLVAAFAWRRRALGWQLLLVASVSLMLLGLLRQPALAGLLLFVGALVAYRRRGFLIFVALLLGVYVAGSAFYSILSAVGLDGFVGGSHAQQPFLAQVAAGAPDVSDQVTFLRHWTSAPQFTHGATYVGGLIPGNFHWNPSIWSLQVVNPGADINQVQSGGLRLPGPLWAYVSSGWPGVIAMSLLRGFLLGMTTAVMKRVVVDLPLSAAVCWYVVYAAIVDVIGPALLMSYISVLSALALATMLRRPRHAPAHRPALAATPVST